MRAGDTGWPVSGAESARIGAIIENISGDWQYAVTHRHNRICTIQAEGSEAAKATKAG
jgi:hypothetical protein